MANGKLCCLVWCPNSSRRTRSADARYFSIPAHPFVGQAWRDWISKENAPVSKSLKCPCVCNRHFPEHNILVTGKVVPGAVPSIGRKTSISTIADEEDMNQRETLNLSDLLKNREPPTSTSSVNGNHSDSGSRETLNLSTLLRDSEPVLQAFAVCGSAQNLSNNKENDLVFVNAAASACETQELQVCAHDPLETVSSSTDMEDASSQEHKFDTCAENSISFIIPPTNAQPSELEKTERTSPNRISTIRARRKFYVGDLSPADFSSPQKAEKYLKIVKQSFASLRRKMKVERNKRYRMQARVKRLEYLLKHSKEGKKIS